MPGDESHSSPSSDEKSPSQTETQTGGSGSGVSRGAVLGGVAVLIVALALLFLVSPFGSSGDAEFQVWFENDNPEPLAVGDDFEIDVTVSNAGNASGEQTITVADDRGELIDASEDVAVDANDSETVEFSAPTDNVDPDKYEITVGSENDEHTTTLDLRERMNLEILSFDVVSEEDPVEGKDVTVSAEIENTGIETAEQTVQVDAEELGSDSEQLELGSEESADVEFSFETEETSLTDGENPEPTGGNAGEHTAVLETEDDSAELEFSILQADTFELEYIEGNVDDDLEVSLNVENLGEIDESQYITLEITNTDDSNSTERFVEAGQTERLVDLIIPNIDEIDGVSEDSIDIRLYSDDHEITKEVEVER